VQPDRIDMALAARIVSHASKPHVRNRDAASGQLRYKPPDIGIKRPMKQHHVMAQSARRYVRCANDGQREWWP